LAEKLRQAKLQAIRASGEVSQAAIDRWQAITPQEIVHDYRNKCKQSQALNTEADPDGDA